MNYLLLFVILWWPFQNDGPQVNWNCEVNALCRIWIWGFIWLLSVMKTVTSLSMHVINRSRNLLCLGKLSADVPWGMKERYSFPWTFVVFLKTFWFFVRIGVKGGGRPPFSEKVKFYAEENEFFFYINKWMNKIFIFDWEFKGITCFLKKEIK